MKNNRLLRLIDASINSYVVYFKRNIFLTISLSVSILIFLGVSLFLDFNYATYVKGNARVQDNYVVMESCSEQVASEVEASFYSKNTIKCMRGALGGGMSAEDESVIPITYNVLAFNNFFQDIYTYSGIDYFGNINDNSNVRSYEKYQIIAGRDCFQNENEIIVSSEYADIVGVSVDSLINSTIDLSYADSSNVYKIVGVFSALSSEKIINKNVMNNLHSPDEDSSLIVTVIIPEEAMPSECVIGVDYYHFFGDEDEYNAILSKVASLKENDKYKDEFNYITPQIIKNDNDCEWSSMLSIKTILLLIVSVFSGISVFGSMHNSIADRKKEIGIKKAIGATDSDIIIGFLFENMLNSFVSIVLSISMASLVFLAYAWYQRQVLLIDYTIHFYPVTIILFICYAVSIIIGFSLIPAYRATQINVIDTLRDE